MNKCSPASPVSSNILQWFWGHSTFDPICLEYLYSSVLFPVFSDHIQKHLTPPFLAFFLCVLMFLIEIFWSLFLFDAESLSSILQLSLVYWESLDLFFFPLLWDAGNFFFCFGFHGITYLLSLAPFTWSSVYWVCFLQGFAILTKYPPGHILIAHLI